jgi:hypothetical protein
MKPINFIDSNCESKSSNCVIWDGPDIPCISLCKGQSVGWAIYMLATKLCALEEQLDLSNYDLTQMTAEYGAVTSYSQMIQNIITKTFPKP